MFNRINKYTIQASTYIRQNNSIQFCIFLFILFVLSSLMILWYFPSFDLASGGRDLMFHANRFYAISEAIDFGSYPFYINAHTLGGYGYATNLFYPDIMLLPFVLLIKPLGLASAYKLLIFTYTILCGILSYCCVRKVTKDNLVSFIFALLYTFALYRIIDFSYRGALSEFIAFTFIPIVFLGLHEIIYGDYKRKWYIITIGFTCLIYTHLLSAFLIFLMVCIVLVISYKAILNNPKRLVYLTIAGIATLLLCAMCLLPMFEQLRDNSFYFQVYPLAKEIGTQSYELKRIIWSMFNGLTDQPLRFETVGILLTISILLRITIKGKYRLLKIADISLIFGLVLVFAISDKFPWYIFPFNQLRILQFPFRLLQPADFLLVLSGAIYLSIIIRKTNRYILILAIIVVGTTFSLRTTGAVYQGYAEYKISNNRDNNYDLDSFEIVGAEYQSSKVPFSPTKDIRSRVQYLINRGDTIVCQNRTSTQIENLKREKQFLTFQANILESERLILPLLYYKGYKATINNKETLVAQSSDGLVEINISESGDVKIWYDGTTLQRVSFVISILSLIGLITYIIISRKKKLSI